MKRYSQDTALGNACSGLCFFYVTVPDMEWSLLSRDCAVVTGKITRAIHQQNDTKRGREILSRSGLATQPQELPLL